MLKKQLKKKDIMKKKSIIEKEDIEESGPHKSVLNTTGNAVATIKYKKVQRNNTDTEDCWDAGPIIKNIQRHGKSFLNT